MEQAYFSETYVTYDSDLCSNQYACMLDLLCILAEEDLPQEKIL